MSWDAVLDRVSARYEALAGMERASLKRKRGIFRKEMDKMDSTLEKRAMDMIWMFLTQDTQHLYAYNHRPQKPACLPCVEAQPAPAQHTGAGGHLFPRDQCAAGFDPCGQGCLRAGDHDRAKRQGDRRG